MIHFDQVLPKAKEVLERSPINAAVTGILVLRDIRGRVRLFLRPADGKREDVAGACDGLRRELEKELAPFWGGVVDLDRDDGEFGPILAPVRGEAIPVEPADEYPRWQIIERHVAKSAWTSRIHQPPWPLNAKTLPIVAWYSHKGGVGRSTALCAAAMHLARNAKRVVVLDLDLESPGLGTLLAGSPVEHGVLDYLLERLLAGTGYDPNINDYLTRQTDASLIGDGGEPIICFPAGKVGPSYLEELTRLDYELLAIHEENTANPLADFLTHIKRELDPAFIFIDCRAGLHDLGGLAVQQLSHANVLFGLDSHQSWDGLRCIIRRLGHVRPSSPPCLIIQAMEDGTPGPRRDEARERFLRSAYDVFCEEYYEENDVPDIAEKGAAHDPFPLAYDPKLAGYQTLSQAVELLLKDPYTELINRVTQVVEKGMSDAT
jgi:hypothetical protein